MNQAALQFINSGKSPWGGRLCNDGSLDCRYSEHQCIKQLKHSWPNNQHLWPNAAANITQQQLNQDQNVPINIFQGLQNQDQDKQEILSLRAQLNEALKQIDRDKNVIIIMERNEERLRQENLQQVQAHQKNQQQVQAEKAQVVQLSNECEQLRQELASERKKTEEATRMIQSQANDFKIEAEELHIKLSLKDAEIKDLSAKFQKSESDSQKFRNEEVMKIQKICSFKHNQLLRLSKVIEDFKKNQSFLVGQKIQMVVAPQKKQQSDTNKQLIKRYQGINNDKGDVTQEQKIGFQFPQQVLGSKAKAPQIKNT